MARFGLCVQCGDDLPRGGMKYCSRPCYWTNKTLAPEVRFWAFVDRRGPDECWPWTGARDDYGYGLFSWNGKQGHASRFALESALGHALGGLLACHRCDNPPCCNPAHLWAGTQSDNLKDQVAKGRHWQRAKTHCAKGHPFNEANTRINSPAGRGPTRACRPCDAQRQRAYKERRKEAQL